MITISFLPAHRKHGIKIIFLAPIKLFFLFHTAILIKRTLRSVYSYEGGSLEGVFLSSRSSAKKLVLKAISQTKCRSV